MNRIAFLFLALACCIPAPADTSIRLVDAREKAPLEYWMKTKDLPNGGKMIFAIPQRVFIDGREMPLGAWGNQNPEGLDLSRTDDAEGLDGLDDIMNEVGGATKEPEINSDRTLEVTGGDGVKALVRGEYEPGERKLEPGGATFTVSARGGFEKASDAFEIHGPASMSLLCHPLDLNFVPAEGMLIGVKISSGGHVFWQGDLAATVASSIRIYVPYAADGYVIEAEGIGKATVTFSKSGAVLKGNAELDPNWSAIADGEGLSFNHANASKPRAPKPTSAPELYVFIDRARSVFLEGEHAEVSIRSFGEVDGAVALQLTDDAGKTISIGSIETTRAGIASVAEATIDTASLRPGRYTLSASAGALKSNPIPFQVAAAMPATNLNLFVTTKWGLEGAPDYAVRMAAGSGFNTWCNQMGIGHSRPAPFPSLNQEVPIDKSKFAEFRGSNFLPELLELPLQVDAEVENLLASGMSAVPNIYGSTNWMILYFNVRKFWLDQAQHRYQTAQHIAQALRRFPNFDGMIYCTGDGPTPATLGMVWATAGVANFDVWHEKRLAKLREVFEQTYGGATFKEADNARLNEVTEEDRKNFAEKGSAWGFRANEEIKGLTLEGTDEDKVVIWNQWVNDLYPEQFRWHRKAMAEIIDDPIVNCGQTWGPGIGGGMYPGTFYRDQDFPMTDTHGDFGTIPSHWYTNSDMINMGLTEKKQRTWEALELVAHRDPLSGYKIFLEALSRNPAGIGVMSIGYDDIFCGWGQEKRLAEPLMVISNIATRFGDTFKQLNHRDEIAVVSSFRQEAIGGSGHNTIFGAHYVIINAGYQADVITDALVETNPDQVAADYRAVLLVRLTAKPTADFLAGLKKIQEKGGLVIADSATTIEIPGAFKLPFAIPDATGMSNETNHLDLHDRLQPTIDAFRTVVRGKLAPYCESSDPYFFNIRSQSDDLQYHVIYNSRIPPDREHGVMHQFWYQPGKAKISLNNTGILYDVLTQQVVPTMNVDGKMTFDVDATTFPGSVYVLTPRPISQIEITHTPAAVPGELIAFNAAVLDDAGKKFGGKLPLEITLTDPNGVVRYHLHRTTNTDITLKIAANDPAGAWTFSAREQASGFFVEGKIDISGDAPPAIASRRDALVYDAAAVHDVLHKRAFEIVLFPEQSSLLPEAQKLQKDLESRGLKATLRTIWPGDLTGYPQQWEYLTIEDREIYNDILGGKVAGLRHRGKNQNQTYEVDRVKFMTAFYLNYAPSGNVVYYKDVILLGRADVPSNLMIDQISRCKMLPRNISASFPGTGSGMVAHAWAPFQFGHNAVLLYGHEEAGLGKAINSLLSIADLKEQPARDFRPRIERKGFENGQMFEAMGLKKAAATAVARGGERQTIALLPPVYDRQVDGVLATKDGKIYLDQKPLAGSEKATLAEIDLAAGTAKQFSLPKEVAPGNAASLAAYQAAGAAGEWPDTGVARAERRWIKNRFKSYLVEAVPADIRTPAGDIVATDTGVGLFDRSGKNLWWFDASDGARTRSAAQYCRIVQRTALSADGKWLAVASYDTTELEGGVTRQNAGEVAILDAATGKLTGAAPDYIASRIAISDDGSRVTVLDELVNRTGNRAVPNTHGEPVIVSLDRSGKVLAAVPIQGPVDSFIVSPDGTLAILSYADTRKLITVIDLKSGTRADVSHPRIDWGLTVAPDASFVVATYTDGLVRGIARDGKITTESRLPTRSRPVVAGGSIYLASNDGKLYQIDDNGTAVEKLDFGSAAVTELAPEIRTISAKIRPPQNAPFWERFAAAVETSALPEAPLTQSTRIQGEQKFNIDVSALNDRETLIFSFDYKLEKPDDVLSVSFEQDGQPVTLKFGYELVSHTAWVALRGPARKVDVTIASSSSATLSGGKLMKIAPKQSSNVALTPPSAPGQHDVNVLEVLVPQPIGIIGDPRFPPMDYGMEGLNEYSFVDGKLYTGTPLFPAAHVRGILRAAEFVIEFPTARTIRGAGIFEDPSEVPVADFILEYCDRYEINKSVKTMDADWKIAAVGRRNDGYFHMHLFEPVKARVWRYTILGTAASLQRLGEIELYEDEAEGMLDLDDIDTKDEPAGQGIGE